MALHPASVIPATLRPAQSSVPPASQPLTPLTPAFLLPAPLSSPTLFAPLPPFPASTMPSSRTSRRRPMKTPPPSSPNTVQVAANTASSANSSNASLPDDPERSQRGGSRYRGFAYPSVRSPQRSAQPLQPVPTHPAAANRHYVFVYGTLKRGFANAHVLERATYIGEFRTQSRFPLVVGGLYNSPYLLDMHGKGARVKGEVYAVDDATLADLDHLENVGRNYSRKVAKVANCADRAFVAEAFVYFKSNGLEELAGKQYLEDYQCRKYVPRHLRSKEPAAAGSRR